jgi:hypothetical protein
MTAVVPLNLDAIVLEHYTALRERIEAGAGPKSIARFLTEATGERIGWRRGKRAIATVRGMDAPQPARPAHDFDIIDTDPIEDSEATIEELIAHRVKVSQRKIEKHRLHRRSLELPAEPLGVVCFGDPHVDNDGCDFARLIEHIRLTASEPGMLAVCVGDMQDNWIGRLARLYADASVTASDGWRLSSWLLSQYTWLAIVGGNHDCHDDQTEVLTRRGWLPFTDVRPDDTVLGLDPSGAAVWQPIERQVAYAYDGPLHRIETARVSAAVTPNHRVLYRPRKRDADGACTWGELTYRTPAEIRGRVSLPVAGRSTNDGIALTDAQLRVAAWILTDGHIETRDGGVSRIRVYQRESNMRAVASAFDDAGIAYKIAVRDRKIESIQGRALKAPCQPSGVLSLSADESRKVAHALDFHDKSSLPSWTIDLSDAQFEVFLSALMAGDGTWAKSGNAGAFYKSERIVNQLQALCVQHGYTASVYRYRDNQHRLNIYRGDGSQLDWRDRTEHYTGDVYCLTVPQGNFCVRRNGKAHFSGNSWAKAAGVDPLEWLTKKHCVKAYASDEVRLTLSWRGRPDIEPLVWVVRHDFRGRSWYHPTHGPNKEAMLDGRAHLLTAGHIHQWGTLHTEQRHGRITHAVRVRGYKRADTYAMTAGFSEQEHGEAVLVVIDPCSDNAHRVTLWWDLAAGVDYLRTLRERAGV